MAELHGLVGGYLVTFVEREGRMRGIDLAEVERVVRAAHGTPVTVAGGVTTLEELAAIDRLGADAQVGMALYTGKIDLADGFAAPLVSDRPDGLWPTLVVDEREVLLGLAWSDRESLRAAIHEGVGAYHSRKRGLWVKGATSGATQELLSVAPDCDRDALRFKVRQTGVFCHAGTRTCFGADRGLGALARLTLERARSAPQGSYTRRLLDDAGLLGAKLREEAAELERASTHAEVVHEAADLLYFSLVKLARHGVDLAEVEGELDRRSLLVSRRPGDAKPPDQGAAP
jgi:phosphoribosyl-ATP pyrophosphohydrolase